jgi:hypothetical protein
MACRIANLAVRAGSRQKLPLSTSSPFLHRVHLSSMSERLPEGLQFWPDYFTVNEQKILLQASLHKLDNSESVRSRKRRRKYPKTSPANLSEAADVQNIFLPDGYYEFQEVWGSISQVNGENNIFRGITTELSAIIARCIWHHGQRMNLRDSRMFSNVYITFVPAIMSKRTFFIWPLVVIFCRM